MTLAGAFLDSWRGPWIFSTRARACQGHLLSRPGAGHGALSPDVYLTSRLWDAGGRRKPGSLVMSKILLAEDDIDMRRFLVKALQNAGFEVISYDNGLSAYQRLREEPFELLLTDIVMPEMDGIELARRAAELDPDIKIMFITGFAAVALNSDSSAPKHAKVLSKPIHLRELVTEVQKLLAA
jgi:two-component system cell cycle response regulator CpdR